VVVIDREQIESSGAANVAEVLRQTSFVQVSDLYGDGSRAQIDTRGFGDTANANTLILVDGRRLNNADITPPDINSISLKDIERIEILEGSGGALYGDQAVGGVINIVTRTPEARSLAIETEAGTYDAYGVRLRGGDTVGPLALRLSGESRRNGNYRDHNEIRYSNVLGRGDWVHAGGRVFGEAAYVREDLLTPGSLLEEDVDEDRRQVLPVFTPDYSDAQTQIYRLGAEQDLGASGWRALAEGTWRRSDGQFRIGFLSGFPSEDSSQDRKVGSFNPRLTRNFATRYGEGTITLGGDAQRADYRLVSQLGVSRGRQEQLDGYAQAVLPLPAKVEATAGVRYSDLRGNVQDDFTFTSPEKYADHKIGGGLGLAWCPVESLKLYIRGDRNYRYPKIDEYTGSVPFEGPVAILLDTQHGWSKEIGGEWQQGSVALALSAYRLDLEDEIAFDGGTFVNINLDRTRRDGVTASARWSPWTTLQLALSARYVDAEVRSGPFESADVPMVASKAGTFSATWAATQAWSLYAEVVALGSRPYSSDFDNTLDELPGHGLLNLSTRWSRGPWSVSARVNNVLDKEYSEYGGSVSLFGPPPDFLSTEFPAFYPSPGANGRLTLAYAW
ncbi:MAG: TonB-dependent receptor, partial [Panacagrimonas sp.]